MRYFAVAAERDVLTGLRLAGIEGALAADAREAAGRIADACARADVEVVLVTDAVAAMAPELIQRMKLREERPLLVVIPSGSKTAPPREAITGLIREAIGVKIQ